MIYVQTFFVINFQEKDCKNPLPITVTTSVFVTNVMLEKENINANMQKLKTELT